jgi:hypothetical protein
LRIGRLLVFLQQYSEFGLFRRFGEKYFIFVVINQFSMHRDKLRHTEDKEVRAFETSE